MSGVGARSAYLSWLAQALHRPDASPDSSVEGDVVLGYATGYDAADIAPFVRSLRRVFGGPVALVVDDRADVRALLAEEGVMAAPPLRAQGWAPHPVMQRFAAFDRLLSGWPAVRGVLITDVRDVVFQAPPFEPSPARLQGFVEADAPLGRHAFNMKYLTALAGADVARALADRPCVCVGTVMGPREAMMRFCRLVLTLAATPRSEIGGAFGADQAACNLAAHLGLIEMDIVPNYGRVATLGLTPSRQAAVIDGRIVNPDGTVSPIVHQYDRHLDLAEAVHALWGAGHPRRARERPRTSGDRFNRLKDSLRRRLPELR
ncbi:hypothetical protein [Brevundimonas sp.]|uniref:hypothetical protein n=1 Tax=Brevundimonas sp. TaxID=1871086 RepID=UPI0035B17B32